MSEEKDTFGVGLISLYDLIARVLPGCATIAAVIWARRGSMATIGKEVGFAESIGGYVAYLAAGFIVGTLLTSLTGAFFEMLAQLAARIVPRISKYTAARSWERIDAVGRHHHASAEVLAKMAGEIALCQNLIGGTGLTIALSLRPIDRAGVALLVAVLLFALLTRVIALQHRLRSFEQQWLYPLSALSGPVA